MPDTAAQQTTVEIGGGFQLEIGPAEITVTPDGSSAIRTTIAALASCLFTICVIDFSHDWFLRFAVALLCVVFIWWLINRPDRCLHCTRTSLDIPEVIRGTVRKTRSFPRADIQKIRFDAVGYGRSGAITGLVFDESGKKMKVLAGLKSPEAQKILSALDRLGYDVEHDVDCR